MTATEPATPCRRISVMTLEAVTVFRTFTVARYGAVTDVEAQDMAPGTPLTEKVVQIVAPQRRISIDG